MREVNNVVVFGGGGYLGTVLVDLLLEKGFKVTVYDSFMYGKKPLHKIKGFNRISIIENDIRNLDEVANAISRNDAVINLAGLSSAKACDSNPLAALEINLLAASNIARLAKYYSTKRFIFASTHSVYGVSAEMANENTSPSPVSLYGELKAEAEKSIISMSSDKFHPIIFRMATLFGYSYRMRFDLVLNKMIHDAKYMKKIEVYGGYQWRPLLNVHDAAEAFYTFMENGQKPAHSIYNIGSNSNQMNILDLAKMINVAFPETELYVSSPKDTNLRNYRVSHDRVNSEFKYETKISIESGIKQLIREIEEHEEEALDPDIVHWN